MKERYHDIVERLENRLGRQASSEEVQAAIDLDAFERVMQEPKSMLALEVLKLRAELKGGGAQMSDKSLRKAYIEKDRAEIPQKPIVEDSYKSVFVDVDGTLVIDDLRPIAGVKAVTIEYVNGPVTMYPIVDNIELVKLFYRLGYRVIVWSKTGRVYARLVCKAIGLESYVSGYETKPLYYIDDEDVSGWFGERRGIFKGRETEE